MRLTMQDVKAIMGKASQDYSIEFVEYLSVAACGILAFPFSRNCSTDWKI